MSSKIVLVTDGARSGKSIFAEKYVSKVADQIAYVATAQVLDEEMKRRILVASGLAIEIKHMAVEM